MGLVAAEPLRYMRGDPSVEYEILKARESAERTLGFAIDDETAEEVLAYAKRKCELNHKPDEYLPLLYENEMTDYFMRLAINLRGEMNRVQRMSQVAM